ncbi:MAG TPA: NAD(P)/FAD-dependent oxidoreductase [Candidatus Limnocylindrales bacterium]|nr:NAD(P)/FAD-dependent oxidoreductase [Candidatus Limnocylindrales bacterium]
MGADNPERSVEEVDVLVIGGGVLGTAVAARLSRTTASVVLLEAEDDLAEGASKGNAGIATCFYGAPGTLESRLIAASNPVWEDLCARLDVPYRRMGALMIAVTAEQEARLEPILEGIRARGARAELLTGAQARAIEPMISDRTLGAISLPDEGLIDPMRLAIGYAELAHRNGARIRRATPATAVTSEGSAVRTVRTPAHGLAPRFVVNAAGLDLGRVSAMAGGEALERTPRQGQYWILDREVGARFNRIVFPIPLEHTRGVQVVPTTNGSVLLGPSAQDTDRRDDKSTDRETLEGIVAQIRALTPGLTLDHAIKSYGAIRPAGTETFLARFDARILNLIHVGSRSAGVSLSPALADYVLHLLREAGLDAPDRADAATAVPRLPRLLLDPQPERLFKLDRRYAQVVCACEQVSAAEIAAALTSGVPARSIEGIRKRTRATGGRCQGSVCLAGVAFLCSLHTGLPPERIPYGRSRGTLGIGHAGS